MSSASPDLVIGQGVAHAEMGVGVFVGPAADGYARVFFQGHGERQVPIGALVREASWEEQVVARPRPATPDALTRLWLAVEAEQLPLLENAAALTAAKVDLLPHQIVLTYRIANACPRRFLIADSVGLGKTIETALVLRELASRGELTRALMVVPAGLVENWRRELNDTFNLDFEVFGSEGDVTDRKTNAFAKHNRLIASVDTLKRVLRVRRILQAPPWDLIVFDEAHHLSAYRSSNKVTRTQNFKLAEELRNHCRDLLLLSATPHQGDHFRFWMLIRLLDPSLFENAEDMVDNRHRLNAVVIRRTQADACDANGEPLFARRQVHTQAFGLTESEKRFYDELMDYLRAGYDLAERSGNKGRAIGFVMTIFQKIAASSFAAVGATLRRRLLMLTIHEAIVCDESLDVDGRERALNEARRLIRISNRLQDDAIGRAQVDRLLADARVHLLRKLRDKPPEDIDGCEVTAGGDEDAAATLVSVAIPAERKRIQELLALLPAVEESKTRELLRGLGDMWSVHPGEKIVVFTTYLGSVDTLIEAIETRFPDAGVEVLKGGDHGAKLAAERRFKKPNGPRVLICTAAGREGINLQFARVLFNHDLPWNPMDVEQRIGRIHRYGQVHTAQVYNLVSADTIEGKIFLLLEEKLQQIGKALGKVDERGQITEDLRGQVLGQLSEKLSYEKLYQDAVRDPTLRRTRQELEVALENARTARHVVSELFQELESFRLDDYKQFDDEGKGMDRLLHFVQVGVQAGNAAIDSPAPTVYDAKLNEKVFHFTTDRDLAKDDEAMTLLGIEHPLVRRLIRDNKNLPAERRALVGRWPDNSELRGVVSIWHVQIHGGKGQYLQRTVMIGLNEQGERSRPIEALAENIRGFSTVNESKIGDDQRRVWVQSLIPEMIHRELSHSGQVRAGAAMSLRLLAWVELV